MSEPETRARTELPASRTRTRPCVSEPESWIEILSSWTNLQPERSLSKSSLKSDGDFERVLITPDSLSLPADAAPIFLTCEAEGHRRVNAALDTSMDGWILANAAFVPFPFVGIVGAAIDTFRGAGERYPEEIHLILEPESFESEAARDDWFERRRSEVDEKWKTAIDALTDDCGDDWDDECQETLDKMNEQWVVESEDLEARRAAAAIVEF